MGENEEISFSLVSPSNIICNSFDLLDLIKDELNRFKNVCLDDDHIYTISINISNSFASKCGIEQG